MKVPSLLLLALVALTPLSAVADEALVKFDGAIGADSVSAAHQGAAGTATGVTLNIVRGVQPPAQLWRIADFEAEVTADGRIRATGRGLVFAGQHHRDCARGDTHRWNGRPQCFRHTHL